MTIKTKLQIILMTLFLFIAGLVALNFYTFESLKGDAPAVNLSGSLRMRGYQLAWLSARLNLADQATKDVIKQTIAAQVATCDKIMNGLDKGDASLHLVATTDADSRKQLEAVKSLWDEYKRRVESTVKASDMAALQADEARVSEMVSGYREI